MLTGVTYSAFVPTIYNTRYHISRGDPRRPRRTVTGGRGRGSGSLQRPGRSGPSAIPPRDPQDDVAVALVGAPHRPEPMHHRFLKPDQALAPLVGLGLDGHAADRERGGNRLEGFQG
jgi:hypothetical protein